jgi:Ca2+-binding EF-hand superfamily protein
MNTLVKMVSSKEVDSLRDSFNKIDLDGTGLITSAELKEAINHTCCDQVKDDEVERIINEVDYFGNHKISYSEFLSATISV